MVCARSGYSVHGENVELDRHQGVHQSDTWYEKANQLDQKCQRLGSISCAQAVQAMVGSDAYPGDDYCDKQLILV